MLLAKIKVVTQQSTYVWVKAPISIKWLCMDYAQCENKILSVLARVLSKFCFCCYVDTWNYATQRTLPIATTATQVFKSCRVWSP